MRILAYNQQLKVCEFQFAKWWFFRLTIRWVSNTCRKHLEWVPNSSIGNFQTSSLLEESTQKLTKVPNYNLARSSVKKYRSERNHRNKPARRKEQAISRCYSKRRSASQSRPKAVPRHKHLNSKFTIPLTANFYTFRYIIAICFHPPRQTSSAPRVIDIKKIYFCFLQKIHVYKPYSEFKDTEPNRSRTDQSLPNLSVCDVPHFWFKMIIKRKR